MFSLSLADRPFFGNKNLIQRAISILRRYGTNAHIYLPGVGMLNGLTAANYLDSALITPATIDNPVGGVVDALGGINATQPTTASKPILRRGAVAVSVKSGDLTGWQTTAAATITGGQADPFGGTTAQLMSGAGKNAYLTGPNSSNISAGETVTQLIHCYSATLGTVVVGSPNGGATSAVNIAAGWGVYAFTWTAFLNDGPSILLTGTLTSITVYRSALFRGTYTSQQIQALGGIPLTTTAPASTALGAQYWQFDGSNDSLSLGSVPFQTNDDICIIAGSAPSTGIAAGSKIFGIRGVSGNSIISLSVELSQSVAYQFRDDSLVNNTGISPASAFLPGSSMVASVKKVGSNSSLRVNGLAAASSAVVVGASTFSTNLPNIGSENASKYFNGSIYPVIAIKGTVTDPDLLLLEKFVANLSGVTL